MNPLEIFKKAKSRQIKFQKYLNKIAIPDYTLFSIFAMITGAVAGLGAVLFHETIAFISELSFEKSLDFFSLTSGVFVIAIPAIGMLIQSLMIKTAPNVANLKGVSEVIKAVAMRGGFIRFRTTVFHFLAPVICLGTGGTLGPEGPIAQLGGGLASKLGQVFGFSDVRRRIFTAAGAGAAIAAVFNTPLGGIFFALEIVLLNDFQTTTFSALILASVTASAISRIFLGNIPIFHFDSLSVGSYNQIYLFAILGIAAGLLSLLYIRYADAIEHLFQTRLLKRIPQWLVMVFAGLLVGVSGYYFNDIFGIGYIAINKILSNSLTWQIVVILLILKFLLVPIMLHSGGFGGQFAPSLFIGAGFGYLYAILLNTVWGMNIDTTSYVLVSMGAVLGGINTIPISAILIIFEMTKDYSFILPLMLAVVLSTMTVNLILKGSIYEKHLERQGFHISRGRESSILKSILVEDVVRKDIVLIPENTPLPEITSKFIESSHGTFYVINKQNVIIGAISERELRPIITEYDTLQTMLIASDIARTELIIVKSDYDLEHVLKLFGKTTVNEFPVVSTSNPDEIIGTVSRHDVISAYDRESLKYNLTEGFAREIQTLNLNTTSHVAKGYSLTEKKVPAAFVGKTLSQLRLRNNYGLEVVMLRKAQSPFAEEDKLGLMIPDPGYSIRKDDTLILFGANENITKIKDLE